MGIIACYTMVNDAELAKLSTADPKDMRNEVETISETHELLDIDEFWDGLHFLLTGQSASRPLEGDPISEAIVGVTNLNEDNFTAYIRYEELDTFVDVLSAVDFPKLRAIFHPCLFSKEDIYPDIWDEREKDMLFSKLENAFSGLLQFYKQALIERMNIIVSIY